MSYEEQQFEAGDEAEVRRGMSTPALLALIFGGVVGVPCVLMCGGCLLWTIAVPIRSAAPQRQVAPKVQEVAIYAPTVEVICATDPDFLDSSPLIAPARFVRIQPGTELVREGFGGMLSKLYWRLTPDGKQHVYVYDDQFKRQWREVRQIKK